MSTGIDCFIRAKKLLPALCFWDNLTLYQKHRFLFGTLDSCILISMITIWCSFCFPLLFVCVEEREGEKQCVYVCVCVCDFYVSFDRPQTPFRFEKSSKLLLGKLTRHSNKFAAGNRESRVACKSVLVSLWGPGAHCGRKWSHAAPNTVSFSLLGLKLISVERAR